MSEEDDPFHDRELEIRRLCKQDAQFAAIWADYLEIRAALRRLATEAAPPPDVLADCRRLGRELADEIAERLATPGPQDGK